MRVRSRGGSAMGRSIVAVTLTIAGVLVPGAPASATPIWSVLSAPAGAASGSLADVSCVSPTSCFAVGAQHFSTTQITLVERWDGTKWSIVSSPNPAGARSSQLTAVHCVTSTTCFAVGQYSTWSADTTLVERWDGTKWSIVSSPNPAGAAAAGLSDVQCTSATRCVAVGSFFVSSETATIEQTLVELWNGSSWSIVASPNVSPTFDSSLTGVSCTGSSNCFAVGQYATDLVVQTLIEHWDGRAWSLVASPNSSVTDSELSAISCPSATSCFAVGFGRRTLVEHWNGLRWSIQAIPTPSGASGAGLVSVSCPSLTRCFAVGDSFDMSVVTRLVEAWNGTSWSIVNTPIPAGASFSRLSGVSCSTTTSCFAVGEYERGAGVHSLLERYA